MKGWADKEKVAIRGMVLAGNYGWAILALMELLEVTELHCREQVAKNMRGHDGRHEERHAPGIHTGSVSDVMRWTFLCPQCGQTSTVRPAQKAEPRECLKCWWKETKGA